MHEYVFTWAGWQGPCVYRSDAAGILGFMSVFCGWCDKTAPKREIMGVSFREFRA